jgi:PBP1b-binding outer membrane lipoprotein LpoB
MKKLILTTIALSVFLTGCVSSSIYDFEKEGANSYEKTNTQSECSYQIKLNKTPKKEQAELLNLCMEGNGYRYNKVN